MYKVQGHRVAQVSIWINHTVSLLYENFPIAVLEVYSVMLMGLIRGIRKPSWILNSIGLKS